MAVLLRRRQSILKRMILPLFIALPLVGLANEARPAALVDAVLAEVDSTVITASDIALARGLRLFGFEPDEAPIRSEGVDRFVDTLLVEQEAVRLQILPAEEEANAAWNSVATRLGGREAFLAWLDENRISQSWARRMVEADLVWRRFIALRFRAFAFVSESDVDAALGQGPHTSEEREKVRQTLLGTATQESLATWVQEARGRARITRVTLPAEGFPPPFKMPAEPLQERNTK
ncbi:MAG TPA: hypothetical protein VEH53_04365 [archaeon]|nr:hypothetical protein [archaeon]